MRASGVTVHAHNPSPLCLHQPNNQPPPFHRYAVKSYCPQQHNE